MKKIFFIICISCVIYSCTTENLVEELQNKTQTNEQTRGIVSDSSPSVTNPTLLTDWENLQTVVLNRSTQTDHKDVYKRQSLLLLLWVERMMVSTVMLVMAFLT